MAADALARRLNLALLLAEEAEEGGRPVPPELDEAQLAAMSEADIRRYYTCNNTNASASALPPPSREAMSLWFPASKAQASTAAATGVVVAFHNSGNAEDMWTSEGTGARRAPSPLMQACRDAGWQLLAPQLPGRGLRAKEPHLASLQDLARELLPLLAPAIQEAGGRYAVVGHSMGAWAAFETVLALGAAGLPQPRIACLSAMPWPHMPAAQRPWRQQHTLGEAEFKAECAGWDISQVVLTDPGLWQMYQPMLRADFQLFDNYASSSSASSPELSCALALFWGSKDRRITQAMVERWRECSSSSAVSVRRIDGTHLWPLEPKAKAEWLGHVSVELRAAMQ